MPTKRKTMEENKDLNYWKNNAEEDYMHTPISVLRYITELEQQVKSVDLADVGESLCNHEYEDVNNFLVKCKHCGDKVAI